VTWYSAYDPAFGDRFSSDEKGTTDNRESEAEILLSAQMKYVFDYVGVIIVQNRFG
jgi:hypothetical protein